jgi:hypothetical protein
LADTAAVASVEMGKGRDKRRRKAKQGNTRVRDEVARAYKAALETLPGSRPANDPPILGEPDAPVGARIKPKPNLRSGAIAIPEPEPEEFMILKPR